MLLSVTPEILLPPVWPDPLSLATTRGISVDVFSSPYLDVSVQAVPHVHLFDSMHVTGVLLQWVSPFGNLRIIGYLLLPEAYRSLSRPSSAPDAKAFPLRSFQLDLSNHLLILKVELCRQFNRIFEIVIVTHLYDVPQLKLKIRSSVLSNKRPLCCLAYHFFITLFSFQGSIFQLLLQPDLKICLTPGLQIQQQTAVSVSRPPDEIRLYLALHARCNLLVGPSGLEPPTLRLSVVRSSQLSYGPVVDADFISFAATFTSQLTHSIASPLRITNASLVCDSS